MRPVNLLPERYRAAQASGRLRGSSYVTVGVLAVVLLMVAGYVLTNNSINDAKQAKQDAEVAAQAAEARAVALGAFGNFKQIKLQREGAVKSLALTRFDYERLMLEMALILPKNVFLQTFNAGAAGEGGEGAASATTGPALSVGGCAPSHRDVATTVVRLRGMHNVVDVTLANSTKSGEASTNAASGGVACRVGWAAQVTFEPEEAPEKRPSVPARLGGGA